MYFIKPNNQTFEERTVIISPDTISLLYAYSSYAKVTEDEVIDTMVKNIACDKDFIRWLREEKENEEATEALAIIEKILNEK